MASLRFEGHDVTIVDGDTVASAMYRAGVRTFTRSLKLHRRRSLYCGTGECPNCLITVNETPGIRSCVTPALDGMRVERQRGWPSTDHDLFRVAEWLHPLMPVGFYHKTFVRPRFAWPLAERLIRRTTGLGRLSDAPSPDPLIVRHVRTDVLVVGGGLAGLTAALAASHASERVVLCDETPIGSRLAPGSTRERVRELADRLAAVVGGVEVLDRHAALGLYAGPLVPLAAEDEIVQVHPGRIVLATGATEIHPVFPGNDLPGIWLGRAASRMVALHGVPIGRRLVVAASTPEGIEHLHALVDAGATVVAALVPAGLVGEAPTGIETITDGIVNAARGRGRIASVTVRDADRSRRIACDGLVLSVGLEPRDALARMAVAEPVRLVGDVAGTADDPVLLEGGTVCLCEDVSLHDLGQAWREGYRSSEILKRYTTVTMGPCRGAMCGRALARFASDRWAEAAVPEGAGGRTTARPPVRPVTLAAIASAVHEAIDKRTPLHEVHLATGARMHRSGGWQRPFAYGDPDEEYRAVRERASVMDVGTLGKFLIAGRDAAILVDRVFPSRIRDLAPGRSRYVLALDEAGYVVDDGVLCALEDDAYYLTSTTGGAEQMDARLRQWADLLDLHVHLLDRTAELGAINVAGPLARELVQHLSDDPLDAETFPYPGHREVTVGGVPCRAIRSGFVGEVAFELHHPRSHGPELWNALLEAGRAFDVLPHGLDALELLRLEKAHLYIGQDTMPDDTPVKLGLDRAVDMSKPAFVGKVALERLAPLPPTRRLVGLEIAGETADVGAVRGIPLTLDGAVVGRVTSAGRSIVLDRAVALGWIRSVDGAFPTELRAGRDLARVVPTPFYDPQGVRLRG